jgi:hypothetical protein
MLKYLIITILVTSILDVMGRLIGLAKQDYPRLITPISDIGNLIFNMLLFVWTIVILIGVS